MSKVTVCIATYNRSSYLRYAVQSILAQTYPDWELIICDDASTDDTPAVVASFTNTRVRYLPHPHNLGRSQNMRSGFADSQSEYFVKLDDDDALTPDFLEKTVEILEGNPQVDFVCTNHWIINAQGKRMESATLENAVRWGKDRLSEGIIPDLVWQTYYYQSLQAGSTLFRRSSLEDVDYMRPEADGCEDFDLLIRLALAGKQGYYLPEYLMEYRLHGGQVSLEQSIHFLRAKLFCVEGYEFTDSELEKERLKRKAALQETLGMRLIEQGREWEGRQFLEASTEVLGYSRRYQVSKFLSFLPLGLRRLIFASLRRLKAQDYSARVRESAGLQNGKG
jgi:glycosyltransferase involved in cell wall biosynthesis